MKLSQRLRSRRRSPNALKATPGLLIAAIAIKGNSIRDPLSERLASCARMNCWYFVLSVARSGTGGLYLASARPPRRGVVDAPEVDDPAHEDDPQNRGEDKVEECGDQAALDELAEAGDEEATDGSDDVAGGAAWFHQEILSLVVHRLSSHGKYYSPRSRRCALENDGFRGIMPARAR